MKKYKTSAVDLTDLAIGIVVLGIVVAIGANVLLTMRDNRLTDLDTITTTNESVSINSSTDTFAHTWGISVSQCYCNVTGSASADAIDCPPNTTIVSDNYTTSIDSVNGGITIQNASTTGYDDAACTYSWYNTSRPDWSLADNAATGISEYGNWFDIIVIVGVAALVLSLIFLAFGRGGRGGAGIGGTY